MTSTQLISENQTEDDRVVDSFSKPAWKETIMAHLVRATALIPIKGTNKDSDPDGDMQSAYILKDYTTRLIDREVTELQLFLALEDLIEKEEFFPSYAKLNKAIEKTGV